MAVAADFTHLTGLDKLADAYDHITSRNCGCDERRQWLNRLFPGYLFATVIDASRAAGAKSSRAVVNQKH
jgi:hypothetical protein